MKRTARQIDALAGRTDATTRTRKVTQVTVDEDGKELSRETVDVPASYAWVIVPDGGGKRTWRNADKGFPPSPAEGEAPNAEYFKVKFDGERRRGGGGPWPCRVGVSREL